MIDFQDYLSIRTFAKPLNLNSYKGIKKTEHPKWLGWKEINLLKNSNPTLQSEYLDVLVYNFYMCEYIANKFYV